jgi:hypothetical protein
MLDFVDTTDVDEEAAPNMENVGAAEDEELEAVDGKQTQKGGQLRYYGKRQQLELVLATEELSKLGDCEVDPTGSGKEED